MRHSSGFTITELVIFLALIIGLTGLFLLQRQTSAAGARDDQRKIAINTIDYALRQSYFTTHEAYPRRIEKDTLAAIDPALLKDPSGRMIGAYDSDYRYEPAQCEGNACKAFTLRANLEREADFVKQAD